MPAEAEPGGGAENGAPPVSGSQRAALVLGTPEQARSIAGAFSGKFGEHALIHLIAILTLASGLAASLATGVSVDVAIAARFGKFLAAAFAVAILAAVLWRFLQLAIIERHDAPSRELAGFVRQIVANRERFHNGGHFFAGFVVFAAGFSALKPSIAILQPFGWDPFLRDLDRFLHFGRLPHEWLGFITTNPAAVMGFNIVYNLWFFVLLAALFSAGFSTGNPRLRLRFITAFMLTWSIAGFLVASGFSSAGPCYFERIGAGADYAGLMGDLDAANAVHTIWALATQEMLWEGFKGVREGSAGISAFPSLHVATATLIAIAAWKTSRLLGLAAIAFAVSIQLGSVVLAWHYAVDGYAGALLAFGFWRLSARLVPAHIPPSPASALPAGKSVA